MEPDRPDCDLLETIPIRYAQPDPTTLATLPKGGAQLSYMGHAEVTLALLDVDPLWTWEPLAIDAEHGRPVIDEQGNRLVMWGYLTVGGLRRMCVGTCEARKGDPEKELIGDLLRNGAMRFGIGTKLWSKATDADPDGSGEGGFKAHRDAPESPFTAASLDLFARVKAAGGTPVGATLKEFAGDARKSLTARAFDADPVYAAQIDDILATVEPTA